MNAYFYLYILTESAGRGTLLKILNKKGIASKELVIALGKQDLSASFGARGCCLKGVEKAIAIYRGNKLSYQMLPQHI